MDATFDLRVARTARRATLVLRGTVAQRDAATAARLCLALPRRVLAIELDARHLDGLSEDAREVLLALVRAWRRARRGQVCIVASERTMLSLGEREPPKQESPARPWGAGEPGQPAQTAAFL